jgi:hypothetical protein
MQNHIRLDDVLARDVAPRWFEGVAVIQLLARQLLGSGWNGTGFPRAADILIGPGGSLATTEAADGDPVKAAAHLLAQMLSDDAPVRLRLAVSQATATDSSYATLTELSAALEYFERPDPASIVDALRQRALLAAPREVLAPTRIDAVPSSGKTPSPASRPASVGVNRLALVAATLAAVACASVWLFGLGRSPHPATAEIAPNEHGKAVAAPKRPGVKRGASTAGPEQIRGGTAARRMNSGSGESSSNSGESGSTARKAARDAPPTLQVTIEDSSYRYPEESSFEQPSDVAAPAEPPVDSPGSRDAHPGTALSIAKKIYSKADPEVTLPVSVYPRFPPEPPGIDVTGRMVLELTISDVGLVERVRTVTTPRNIHEFMLLSAAKAWRFEPARIDGRAVRFRHMMAIPATP